MLATVHSLENLEKAWGWIKSNPDRMYKSYFRNAYRQHEVVRDNFLQTTHEQLTLGTFHPSTSCKIFFPKPSGILRPYSLLTVTDQLVYQAFCNIIGKKLYEQVGSRYDTKTFGHQYAGEESPWFYKKWSAGYSKYNKAAERVFNQGKIYTASFDLTACYDSIDHNVLTHFLKELDFDDEFCQQLCSYLTVWTATDHKELIYQHHGIPQGPLGSGIISEVVLKAFDDGRCTNGVSYMRYVDDIRLFSKDEDALRVELVRLDHISKKIGLFPQSSKISIHRITDIYSELKNLSHPGSFIPNEVIPQKEIEKEIIKATYGFEIKNISRLRYFSAASKPNKFIENRLWNLYDKYPHVYSTLCNLLKKYPTLTDYSYKRIIQVLNKKTPYQALHAEFIDVLNTTTLDNQRSKEICKIMKQKFYGSGKNLLESDTLFTSNVASFMIYKDSLTTQQIKFLSSSPKWYVRFAISEAITNSPADKGGETLLEFIKDRTEDVALSGANGSVKKKLAVPNRRVPNRLSGPYLNTFGKRGTLNGICLIDQEVRRAFGLLPDFPTIDWRYLLSTEYNLALEIIISCRTNNTVSPSGWLLSLDSFNDVVIRRHFLVQGNIGAIAADSDYGSAFHNNLFRNSNNMLHDSAKAIHDRRVTTQMAHAYNKKSKSKNPAFKFNEKSVYKQHQLNLLLELSRLYPM